MSGINGHTKISAWSERIILPAVPFSSAVEIPEKEFNEEIDIVVSRKMIDMKDMQLNPDRLKIARLRRKLTYTALASACGLSTKSVAEYEKSDGLFPSKRADYQIASRYTWLSYKLPFAAVRQNLLILPLYLLGH